MQRIFSFRQGDRSEYLAQYILSSIAITVPIPRQEDVGSDFHCSLLKRDGKSLRPYLPFNIQIKSYSEKLVEDGISFGGITAAGRWRKHEIDQLCQTETPFLIGIVNKDEQWIELFSTITRYFVLNRWNNAPDPREVILMPYSPKGEEHLGCGSIEDLAAIDGMPGKLWKVPIGQPILRMTIDHSENEAECEKIKSLLDPYLLMDQENGVLARIGLGYFTWPLIMRSGKPLTHGGAALVAQSIAAKNVQKQLQVLARMVPSLLVTLASIGKKHQIMQWESIIEQLPLDGEAGFLKDVVKKAIDYAHS